MTCRHIVCSHLRKNRSAAANYLDDADWISHPCNPRPSCQHGGFSLYKVSAKRQEFSFLFFSRSIELSVEAARKHDCTRMATHIYCWHGRSAGWNLARAGLAVLELAILTLAALPLAAQSDTAVFSFPDRGGVSLTTSGTSATLHGGQARISHSGTNVPAGFAIFSLRENNVLVSEATVPAANLVSEGRIYAEIGGGVNTGIAIANANSQP